MGQLKALGPDGLHALFYQNQWDNIGPDVCNWVSRIFSSLVLNRNINHTLLVLIPKVKNPETFSQFRPINLCNILCKIITKIIASQFKHIFPSLIA